MFTLLFGSIVEFLFVIGGGVLVYQIFLSDWIEAKRQQTKNLKAQIASVEKIAQVKLVSDDAKDIEKFITTNAAHISDEMVKKLVERIESIKNDKYIIANDASLERRIDALDVSENENDIMNTAKKVKRV